MGYERIVDGDSLSLQIPAILFRNERLLYLTQTALCFRYACSRQLLRLGLTVEKKQSIVSAHALFCYGDYALPKLLSYYELLRVWEFMATVTTQVNTSGSDQASDGDSDDLTKLVATLQSVIDSESEQARSALKQYTTQQLSLSLEGLGPKFLQ